MKVVIDIPKVLYDRAKKPPILGMYEAIIAKGVPLDKIRAEIKNEQNMDYKCHRKTYDNCLRILNKYKAESE